MAYVTVGENDILQRVAFAIMDRLRPALDQSNFERMVALGISDADIASAAIAEMREPTQAMIAASLDGPPVCEIYRGQRNVLSYQAMIDAALKE